MKALKGDPEIEHALQQLLETPKVPSLIRGSAIKLSVNYPLIIPKAVDFALKSHDSLLNLAGLEISNSVPNLNNSLVKLLSSPHKVVRTQAALSIKQRALSLSDKNLKIFNQALSEYIDSLNINIDDPSSLINLGNLNVVDKDFKSAHDNFDKAIKINPHLVPGYVNKADLYRAQGNDGQAERVLKKALKNIPDSSDTHLALGMVYVRQKETKKALKHFKDSTTFGPDNSQAFYMYALALQSYGNPKKALELLETNYEKFKGWPAFNQLLINLCNQLGQEEKAQDYYAKFSKMNKQE